MIARADKDTIRDFKEVVNMTPSRLEEWLDTQESKDVGFKKTARSSSIGHRSGRRIVGILGKKQEELTESDLKHMRKVTGYVRRHLAQRPEGDVTETPWRYSLKNWGHDPKGKAG